MNAMDSGYIKGETGNKEGVDIYIMNPWRNFTEGYWQSEIDVREFIQLNYSPYEGDESFLAGPTRRTKKLWDKTTVLLEEENKKGGTLNIDTSTVSTITSHGPGYIDKDLEVIVGLQTDEPLKGPLCLWRYSDGKNACDAYGYKLDPEVEKIFTEYRKTHNQGVFDAYTPEIEG